MTVIGRDCWRFSSPAPLFQWGHLNPAATDGIGVSQKQKLHNFPWQPVPVLSHPSNGKVFPDVQGESPGCLSLCPLPLTVTLGTTEKSWLHPLCTPASGVYIHWWDTPWTLSSPRWTVPALSPSSHTTDAPVPSSSSWLFAGLSPVCPCLSLTGKPQNWRSHSRWGDGKKHLPLDLLI